MSTGSNFFRKQYGHFSEPKIELPMTQGFTSWHLLQGPQNTFDYAFKLIAALFTIDSICKQSKCSRTDG